MRSARLGSVTLGAGRVKVVVPVGAATAEALIGRAAALAGQPVDVLEWRVDHLAAAASPDSTLAAARALAAVTDLPVLATLRTAHEGGSFSDDAAYHPLLTSLARSGLVAGIDLETEHGRAADVGAVIAAAHEAGIPVVASFHDFAATPPADQILQRLTRMATTGADVLKVAYMPGSPGDVVALLEATARAAAELELPLITVSMGPLGVLSRIGGGLVGSAATFASVGEASAPGQVPAGELAPFLAALERWSAR